MSIMTIDRLCVRFGGLKAIDNVTLTVERGSIHGLIGPNGAGKTTLINAISGLVPAVTGSVLFEGENLLRRSAWQVAAMGVRRTYQHAEIFPDQTVLDNALAGTYAGSRCGFWHDALRTITMRKTEARARARANDLLKRLGLGPYRHVIAGDLPFGLLKRVDLARAMVDEPSVLMLDEPTSGMSETEAQDIVGTCFDLVRNFGVSLLVVEHNMRVMMTIADTITVLDHGQKIAEGSPAAIQSDPAVIEAYLGADSEDD